MAENARASILFVDDEPDLLNGLRRSLHVHRDSWEARFANGGRAALEELAERPADLVVTDMRMPGMDGVELLSEVRARHPQTLRFVLSGHADETSIPRAIPLTHRWLSKPCSRDVLVEAIERACVLKQALDRPAVRRALACMPAGEPRVEVPDALSRAEDEEGQPEHALREVLQGREGLYARFLETTNSAFFSLPHVIVNLESAVEVLGLKTVGQLALATELLHELEPAQGGPLDAQRLRRHGVSTSKLTSRILDYAGVQADGAIPAGLLHRIGFLIQARWAPQMLVECLPACDGPSLAEAQRARFGTDQAELGAAFLLTVGLPVRIVEAVAFQHDPLRSPARGFGLLAALHVASSLSEDPLLDPCPLTGPDPAFVDRLALHDELPTWKAMARELSHLSQRQAPQEVSP